MDKTVASADKAIESVFDGAVIMMGGFGLCGYPENMMAALRRKGTKNLTFISNNAGTDEYGIGPLIKAGQVKKMIMSYGGECKAFEDMALAGTLEVEWNPQGTLAERIRAAGAGIGGFLHAHRLRHQDRRGQRDASDRRTLVRFREAAQGGLRHNQSA